MKVLITGANGGIGTAAMAELRTRGATVLGLDLQHPVAGAGLGAHGLALAFQGKDAVDDDGAVAARDFLRAVGAAVGDHHHLVAELEAAQAVGEAGLVVMRAHQSR